ncbi:MAG: hypothetical protein K2F99_03355 [Muribaculaceae bacterium]|nr:hypothetical protein [Muribaculaceae bacterium]
MMRKTTTDLEDLKMLEMYLSSSVPIQRVIAQRYKLTQGTISKHIMDAALKYVEEFNLCRTDTTAVRRMKIISRGGDPDFGLLVYRYAMARSSGSLSSAESRLLRGECAA